MGLGLQEILFDVRHGGGAVHIDGALEVVVQAPVVEIDGPHHRLPVVADEALGVDEAGGVGVELHACAVQGGEMGLGQVVGALLVRDPRQDDPHIHPPTGGVAQGRFHLLVQNQVGGHDMDVFFRPVQQVHVHLLAHPVIVQGAVGIGHHEAGGVGSFHRRAEKFVIFRRPQVGAPELEEHDREAPDRRTLEHQGGVLPVAVFFPAADVLVGQVDAAGEAHPAVDDQDLAVVPVVIVGGDEGFQGGEDLAPDAQQLHLLGVIPGQQGEFAGPVVHQPHIHSGGSLALEDLQDVVPHVALIQDEIFQENEFFCLFQLCQHLPEEGVAGGEIGAVGAVEDREAAAAADIPGHACGAGGLALKGLQDPGVLVQLVAALVLPLGHDGFQQPMAHIPTGIPVKERAEDRGQGHHHHPGQLRRGVQVRIQHHQHRAHRQHQRAAHHMGLKLLKPEHHRKQQPGLDQKQQQDQARPSENGPAQAVFTFFNQFFLIDRHWVLLL